YPNAAACFTRSRNGSFVHHISRLAANLVCGVLPSDEVSSAAAALSAFSDKAATPPTAAVARKERRSSVDMAIVLEAGAMRGSEGSGHYSLRHDAMRISRHDGCSTAEGPVFRSRNDSTRERGHVEL